MAGRELAVLTEGTEEDLQKPVMGGGEEGGWSVLCAVSRHGDSSPGTAGVLTHRRRVPCGARGRSGHQ